MVTGFVLAAGQGKRFSRQSDRGKCFFRAGDKLLIEHSINSLLLAGVDRIIIGVRSDDLKFAAELAYKYQRLDFVTSSTKGTAGCLLDMCEHISGHTVVVYGDTVYLDSVSDFITAVSLVKSGSAVIGVKQTNNLKNYMAVIQERSQIQVFIKPHNFRKGLAYVGLFGFCDNTIVHRLRELRPSKRGELEMTDLIKLYSQLNIINLARYNGEFIDCNTPEKLTFIPNFITKFND
ncbi:MAG: hypothetical protein COU22_02980 [Candidatus Komeilibacteria bacterium CG10_big_fil_rev_8_21_14_0_10_41_13]|uniref:Nucleotidyl transferase domain-containing protein n=1 Tax=Candidatus Komeilibacteria bacterium CG10_big_fil_rev_8_21_14_0_10_41_13 TaxID=1974476 RepID=A0A2M6WC07_9BACT|nr:MAG: hypothetical protein COU22_02980 [Candidatus Komeilibacteria bacterium CG10_big_fil_rev_8_21_14_0_10_41_13]